MSANTERISGGSQQLQLVTFMIDSEEFGVDILNVQEINKVSAITQIPGSPEFVEGIINLRGKVVPVIDLRKRFGMSAREHDERTRIIVAEMNAQTMGFIVDAVNEVLRISADSFQPPPDIVVGAHSEFFKSVANLDDKLLVLINLEKLLTRDQAESISSLAAA